MPAARMIRKTTTSDLPTNREERADLYRSGKLCPNCRAKSRTIAGRSSIEWNGCHGGDCGYSCTECGHQWDLADF